MVGFWRSLAIVALCHSPVKSGDAKVAIIESYEEPTTPAATSDKEPLWLVLPLLLDVQPVLLTLDVMRHVPGQIQGFCRHHGVAVTRCYGAVQQVLDEVVDIQRFCKTSAADGALPGFAVTKNVLRESGEAGSAMWLQNDPEDVALDFCSIAKDKVDAQGVEECAEALGKALRLSFDWVLELTPCEQQSADISDVATAASEAPSFVERVAEVEEMVAAPQSSSAPESEDVSLSIAEEANVQDASEISESVEEITETEEAIGTSSIALTELLSDGGACDVAGADTLSCEASHDTAVGRKNDSDPSWKVGASFVLALASVLLANDLMIHVVRRLSKSAEAAC